MAIYHALDGQELQAGMQRVIEAAFERGAKELERFPMFRFHIRAEVTTYNDTGADMRDGVLIPRSPEQHEVQVFEHAGYSIGAIFPRLDRISRSVDCRSFRSYPLVRWQVRIEFVPCRAATPEDSEIIRYNGAEFTKCEDDGIVIKNDSQIVGYQVDPQLIREQAGLGRMVTRIDEGQHVDTYAKPDAAPRNTLEGTKPIVIGSEPIPVSGADTPRKEEARARADTVAAPEKESEAEKIAKQEEATWDAPSADAEFSDAIANGQSVKGRVTVVGAGATPRKRR